MLETKNVFTKIEKKIYLIFNLKFHIKYTITYE